MWLLWLVEISLHDIQNISPGWRIIHAKFKGIPQSGYRAIVKRKCGAGGAGGTFRENFSHMQTSVPRGTLNDPIWPWRRGRRSKITTPKDSQHIISYKLGVHPKPSRSNNKRKKSTLKVNDPIWPWRRGRRSKITPPKDSQHRISYKLGEHPKPLEPIISKKINFIGQWPHLTLKEGSEVKTDPFNRLAAHHFL